MLIRRILGPGLLLGVALLASAGAARAQMPDSALQKAEKPAPGSIKNPYTGKPDAIAQGKQIWFKMSCYGCHGTMGGGGMGPNLTDAEWKYGGDDTSVFTTIKWGRPGGMPAWGSKLSDDDIYHVMAYVRSLYKGDAAHIVW